MIARYNPNEPDTHAAGDAPPVSRQTRLFLWGFSVVLVVTAGTAFLFKLIEFVYTAVHGTGALTSFLIPVTNYLLVAAGFACLFFWAYLGGQFRNVERAKYRMLEMQDEIDRAERVSRTSSPKHP